MRRKRRRETQGDKVERNGVDRSTGLAIYQQTPGPSVHEVFQNKVTVVSIFNLKKKWTLRG